MTDDTWGLAPRCTLKGVTVTLSTNRNGRVVVEVATPLGKRPIVKHTDTPSIRLPGRVEP